MPRRRFSPILFFAFAANTLTAAPIFITTGTTYDPAPRALNTSGTYLVADGATLVFANGPGVTGADGGVFAFNGGASYSLVIAPDTAGSNTGAGRTLFQNNTADKNGGAISIANTGAATSLALTNVTFERNHTNTGYGGAIATNRASSLANVAFTSNTAATSGGALYNTGNATLARVRFDGNRAMTTGGAIYNSTNSIAITGGTLSNNAAGTNGGAVYNTGANTNASFTDILFQSNEAAAGGAIYASSGTITATRARFEGNAAISSHGGAIFGSTGANAIVLTDVTFANNTAGAGSGGAIYTNRGTLTIRATASAANTGNKASGATGANGGFLYITGTDATVNFDITGATTRYVIGAADAADSALDTIADGGTGGAAIGHIINKTGDGALVLNADNSNYRGAINITGGALLLGNAAARLNAGAYTLAGGALGGIGTLTGTAEFFATSTLFAGGGLLAFATTATTGVTLRDGAVIGGSGTLALTGANNALVLAGGVIGATVAAGETLAIATPLAGDAALEKRGAGLLLLAADGNTFAGGVTLAGGTLAAGAPAQLGSPSGEIRFTSSAAAPAVLRIDTDGRTITNTITLAANSSGAIDTQTHTLALAGALVSDAASTLAKTGAGTLAVAGDTAAFAGTLRAAQGVLVVTASNFAGGIALAPGARLETNNTLAIGGTLALDDATLAFALRDGAAPDGYLNSDRIHAAAIAATGSNTIDLRGFFQTGTYNLGNLAALAPAATLTVDGAQQLPDFRRKAALRTSGGLLLVETQTDMSRSLHWTGQAGNLWTGALAGQWTDTGTVSRFADGDRVTFENTAATIAIQTPVTVSDITVAGNATTTFTGAAITADAASVVTGTLANAAGRLRKTGPGTLALDNAANTFHGGITLEEGTLAFTRAAQLAAPAITVTGNAMLSLAAATETELAVPVAIAATATATLNTAIDSTLTLRSAVTGPGALAKTGPGTLTLAAPATHTGPTLVQTGTLRAAAENVLPRTSPVSLAAVATLDLAGHDQAIASLVTHGALDLRAARLTIAGDYAAARATLRLSLALSDTAAPQAGALRISGSATGATAVRIQLTDTRAHAARAPLPDATPALITTGAASPGDAFALAPGQRLVVGAYDYLLLPDNAAAAREWRLVPDNFSPEIPAVAGTDAIALQSSRAALDTLLSRLDDLRVAANTEAPGHGVNIWADALYRRDRVNQTVYTGASIATAGMQAGADLRRTGATTYAIGLFADISSAEMNLPRGTETEASIRGAGLYATVIGRLWHIDAIVRGAKNSYDITAPAAATFSTDGADFGATLQAGRVIATKSEWRIEPLAALAWQRHSIDDTTDGFGRSYKVDDFTSLTARLAVAFDRAIATRRGVLIPRLRVSALHEFDGKSRVTIDGDPIETDLGGLGAELDASLVWQVNARWTFTAAASARAGGKFDGYTLRLGASRSW